MIKVLSTNILSPLGYTARENYESVKSGVSALASYQAWRSIPELFTASMFSDNQINELKIEGYSRFESLAVRSVEEALSHTNLDLDSQSVLFVLSTTKANVDELASEESCDGAYLKPGTAARKIAEYFGIKSEPLVVCNACISGVTAQLVAERLITSGHYDTAIVCGVDVVAPFVVAGFLSFKSLSPYPCRPFDIERLGLNLGEAASTVIFGKVETCDDNCWHLVSGSLNNDAYHVSAPSPQGDGSLQVINQTMKGWNPESLAMVNVHGTATMFNDQMESRAIERAGLSIVPISAFKGYYGHTLGASGLLESVLCMESLDDGVILPVKGFEDIGVSGKVSITDTIKKTDKRSFLKIISGFGGCNGAVLFTKNKCMVNKSEVKGKPKVTHSIIMTEHSLMIDGRVVETSETGGKLLTEVYKKYVGDYSKFYKMDMFSKVVFLASELLIQQEGESAHSNKERGVVLFNSSSSVLADRKHISTISTPGEFFPSPSTFLYTLPNVVTGEISIKHGYRGETSLYILDKRDENIISQIIESSFEGSAVESMVTGWVDCPDENTFIADMKIITIKN